MPHQFNRRQSLKMLGTASLAAFFKPDIICASDNPNRAPRFNIGACDWSINNASNLGAMEMAKAIGLDGVQLSLGTHEKVILSY